MKIETQNYNDISVVGLQGEFTHETLKPFEDAVSSVMASTQIAGIVLDMSKVTLMDSKILEYLLDLNDRCRENLRQLKLAGLDETCRKILEVTRLNRELDAYGEVAEAVKSFV